MTPNHEPAVDRSSALRVERAIVELRRGRALEVSDDDAATVVASLDRIEPELLDEFRAAGATLNLVLTAERGAVLGLGDAAGDALALAVPSGLSSNDLLVLAMGPSPGAALAGRARPLAKVDPRAAAAVVLSRHAQIVPALLSRPEPRPGTDPQRLSVSRSDIAAYPQLRGSQLRELSRARVPLSEAEDCEFVVFRERFGDADHVAVLIGRPDTAAPVPVRLHSACLTGDLLASLRCDCGDQLRGAVARIRAAGGGVLLYLAQEGRGIGLVNKLRAYALQAQGLDTLEADQHLGFRADERDYAVACAMLEHLGVRRVRLLTNNPEKLAALDACAIEVVDRIPLPAVVNVHNAAYLRTKRERAGHLPSDDDG